MDFYQTTENGPNGLYFKVAEFSCDLCCSIDLEPVSRDNSLHALNALKEVIAGKITLNTILANHTLAYHLPTSRKRLRYRA